MSVSTDTHVVIDTDAGSMTLKLWPEVAPKTVENFIKLAGEGFYDGTAFHRIVRGFMIQGGDPLSKEDHPHVGTGGPGYQIKAEFNDRSHIRGVLSMARYRSLEQPRMKHSQLGPPSGWATAIAPKETSPRLLRSIRKPEPGREEIQSFYSVS